MIYNIWMSEHLSNFHQRLVYHSTYSSKSTDWIRQVILSDFYLFQFIIAIVFVRNKE